MKCECEQVNRKCKVVSKIYTVTQTKKLTEIEKMVASVCACDQNHFGYKLNNFRSNCVMTRRGTNTKRGSSVFSQKRKRERKLASLLHTKWNRPGLTLFSLAKEEGLSYNGVCASWKKFVSALESGMDDETSTEIAISDHRGGSNRALSHFDETRLADFMRAMQPPTHSQMRDAAVLMYDSIAHNTRSRFKFVAGQKFHGQGEARTTFVITSNQTRNEVEIEAPHANICDRMRMRQKLNCLNATCVQLLVELVRTWCSIWTKPQFMYATHLSRLLLQPVATRLQKLSRLATHDCVRPFFLA